MNVFDLAARLMLDKTEYDKGLDAAESKGGTFGKAISGAAKAAGAAIAAASTAAVGFAADSVKAGMDFDKSMSQVAATMGKTTDEIKDLRDFAQEMGRTTAFSATEAADALNYMALAGYDSKTSMEMLPNVLNLAAAGNMDLARASDMVTDTQTAFGISLERTTQMVDEMAKAASTGNTSVEQLGDAFLVVGGLAQELNGGMVTLKDGTKATVDGVQEMEIALTAMANAGIKGSEAGTHMRNMLMKLSSPTDEGTIALENMGVAVFDTEGKMRSLSDIFGDLNKSMSKMTQEQKIGTISALFNARDLSSAEALLNAVSQDWDSIGAAILDADGAAQQMAKTQLDNLAGDITLFKSALEGAKIAVSDSLSPTLREFVQFGTDGISQLTAAFQEDGLQGAAEAFGEILSKGIEMIISMLPDIIKAGVSILEALIQGMTENIDLVVGSAVEIIMMLFNAMIDNLPKLLEAGLQIVIKLADAISQNLDEIIPAVVDMILFIAETLTDPKHMNDLLEAGLQIIVGITMGIIKAIPRLLDGLAEVVSNLMIAYKQWHDDTEAAWWGYFKDLFEKIGGWIKEKWEAFKTWGKDLIDNFIAGVKEKFNDIKEVFKSLGEIIKNLIGFSEPKEGPLSKFHTFAPDMIDLFTKGIKDNEGKLRRQMEESFNFSDVATSPEMQVNAAGIGMASSSKASIYYTKKYNVEDEVHELLVLLKTGRARMGAEITNARELKLQNV